MHPLVFIFLMKVVWFLCTIYCAFIFVFSVISPFMNIVEFCTNESIKLVLLHLIVHLKNSFESIFVHNWNFTRWKIGSNFLVSLFFYIHSKINGIFDFLICTYFQVIYYIYTVRMWCNWFRYVHSLFVVCKWPY